MKLRVPHDSLVTPCRTLSSTCKCLEWRVLAASLFLRVSISVKRKIIRRISWRHIKPLTSVSLSTSVPNCIADLKRSIPRLVNERACMEFSEWTATKAAVESASHTGRSRLQAVATAQWGSSLFLYQRASSLQRVRRRLAGEMAVAPQPTNSHWCTSGNDAAHECRSTAFRSSFGGLASNPPAALHAAE